MKITDEMVEAACKAFSESEAVYPDGSATTQITDWFRLDAQDALDFGVLAEPKWDVVSDIRGTQHEWYVASVIKEPMRAALTAALAEQTQQGVEAATRVYEMGIELNGVSAALEYGKGLWRTCTGCHESNEGYPTGPYSIVMKCHLGLGCFECGGIGAIWDTTDYEELGRYLSDERFGGVAETVSVDRSLLQAAINEIREWKVEKGGDDQVVLNLEASMRSEGSDND